MYIDYKTLYQKCEMQSYDSIMIKGMQCNVLFIPKNQVSHIPNKTNIVNYHSIQDIMSLNKTLS